MPVRELMTWIAGQKRWTKMYRGRRYYVSARQLGCPETKEGSIQAANQFWRDKQAEIDFAVRENARKPQAREDIVAALLGGKAWDSVKAIVDAANRHLEQLPLSLEAETLAERIEEAAYHEDETGNEGGWERIAAGLREKLLSALLGKVIIEGESLPEQLRESLRPARVAQLETAVKGVRGDAVADAVQSVQAWVDKWLGMRKALVACKGLKAVTVDDDRSRMAHFAAFVGETSDVATLDAAKLTGFYHFCLSKIGERCDDGKSGWSASHGQKVFATVRSWIRWLAEEGAVEMPSNIASKGFRFGSTAKRIQTWTVEEIQHVVGEASGRLKLALLLMANCGMTQIDVADLHDDEVNWKTGRITRKRSKTANHDSVPTVSYPLWRDTFALLKQYRSGADRVLLTTSGRPFLRQSFKDGKLYRVDCFVGTFNRLKKRLRFKKSMKQLRKTSASMLESHPVYGRFTSLFLGHAPASIKDRHYADVPQTLFDEAVRWLGEQFGFVT
jgi:integrase